MTLLLLLAGCPAEPPSANEPAADPFAEATCRPGRGTCYYEDGKLVCLCDPPRDADGTDTDDTVADDTESPAQP